MQFITQPTPLSSEVIDDRVATVLDAGENVTLNYDDAANVLTISATPGGGGSTYTDEQAQDAVGNILQDSATIDYVYNDTTPYITGLVRDNSITESMLNLSDNTTQNSSTSLHGLLPKLPGNTTTFLRGDGTWNTPAPADAEYITSSTNATLTGERVLTDTETVTWDFTTAGQAKATAVGGSTTSTAYDLGVTWSGTIPTNQVLLRYPFPRQVTFPANLSTSKGVSTAAATGAYVITIARNGTPVGTINFAAAATSATFTMASDTVFAIGDILTLTAQSAVDATLANLGISLAGIRASTPADGGAPNDAQYLVAAAHSGLTSELVVTSAGLALLDDADNTAQRTTLGLGTMATQNANAVAITGGSAAFTANVGTLDRSGDNQFGFISYLSAAGGSNRWGIRCEGTAPSLFNAQIEGMAFNASIDSDSTAFYSSRNAGGTRHHFFGNGTAPSYFGGAVQVVGTVGVRAAPLGNQALTVQYNKGTTYGIVLRPEDSDTGIATAMIFANLAGTTVGSIATTGSATSFNTSSDMRLKHAITTLTAALERVRALRPISFKWNADDSNGVGFLAHELQQIIPESVTGDPEAINDDGSIKPQQVDNSKLVPWLVAGIKELMEQVEILTARVAALES